MKTVSETLQQLLSQLLPEEKMQQRMEFRLRTMFLDYMEENGCGVDETANLLGLPRQDVINYLEGKVNPQLDELIYVVSALGGEIQINAPEPRRFGVVKDFSGNWCVIDRFTIDSKGLSHKRIAEKILNRATALQIADLYENERKEDTQSSEVGD
jgi:hypothetical protein